MVEGAINDALGNSFFPMKHDHIHEFGDFFAAEFWIGQDDTFWNFATTRHVFSLIKSMNDVSVGSDPACCGKLIKRLKPLYERPRPLLHINTWNPTKDPRAEQKLTTS
jgi:hypothetical protein